MNISKQPRVIPGLVLVVCVLALGAAALHRWTPPSRSAEPPDGLLVGTSVGRFGAAGVDVVMWNGTAWLPVLPPSAIRPLEVDGDVLKPRIRSLVVSPDLNSLGMWVVFCGADIEERDDCTSRGYVYVIDRSELIELRQDVAPVAWIDSGNKLLVEDFMAEYGATFDPETGRYDDMVVPVGLYNLSQGNEGVSRDGDLVTFSGEEGEGVVARSTGDVTWLQTSAAHNTAWLALSPDRRTTAVVNIRAGEDNRLGGGELALYGVTGALTATISSGNTHLDFNPVWAGRGQRVAFLRADAGSLRDNVLAYGSDAENLPAAVMTYDVASRGVDTVLPADAVRRGLVAPGTGDRVLFLQRDGGTYMAHFVPLSGGHAEPLLADGDEHTAIGAPR